MYGAMEESTPAAEAPALGPAELKAVRKLLSTSSSIGGSDVDTGCTNDKGNGYCCGSADQAEAIAIWSQCLAVE